LKFKEILEIFLHASTSFTEVEGVKAQFVSLVGFGRRQLGYRCLFLLPSCYFLIKSKNLLYTVLKTPARKILWVPTDEKKIKSIRKFNV
jgi:hypothetical protein